MKISILIPCYNYAKYLPFALKSILRQSFQDFEVIIMDDGSTDGTHEAILSYLKDPRFKYFYQKNGGPAKALNYGLLMAKGEYIAFMDADDYWYPQKLAIQNQCLDKRPEISLCYSNMSYMDYTGKLYGPLLEDHSEKNDPVELLMNCYIKSPSCVMVRKKVLDSLGQFKLGVINHDHDMWLRFIEVSRIHYVPECLSGYRTHDTQVSLKPKMWWDGISVLQDACKRYPYGNKIKRKRLALIFYRLGQTQNKFFYLISGLLDPIRSFKVICKR